MASSEQVSLIFSAVDQTKEAFGSVRSQLNGLGDHVLTVRGLIETMVAALGVKAFAENIKGASEAADAAAKMGDRFGIATESVVGLNLAAKLAGGSNEAVTMGLRTMADQAVKAAMGVQEAKTAFGALNIDAKEFLKLPMDQQFSMVIDRLHNMQNATVRNAEARQLLGRSSGELMGLVAEGSAAIKEATEDTEAWGLALNRVDAAKLEMANDAMIRAKAAAQGVWTQIALQLAPAVKTMADYFSDAKKEANGFRDEAAQGADVVAEAIGYLGNFVTGLRFGYLGLKLALAEFLSLAIEGFARLAEMVHGNPIFKMLEYLPGPLGAAAKAMNDTRKAGVEVMHGLSESLGQLAGEIKDQMDEIANKGLPHDRIVARIEQIKVAMDKAAKEIAHKRAEFNRETSELGPQFDNKEWLKHLALRVNQIQLENLSELDMLKQHLMEKEQALDAAYANGLIGEEEYGIQIADIYARYQNDKVRATNDAEAKMHGVKVMYRQLDAESAGAFLGQMSQLMQSHNRGAFEIGKAAAISKAIIDTIGSAQSSFYAMSGIPIVGPFLGAIAAAAAIALGVANVQKIQSTKFGDSGGAPSSVSVVSPVTGIPSTPIQTSTPSALADAGGSGGLTPPPSPSSQSAQAEQNVHITFVGGQDKSYTYDEVAEEIIPLINQAAGNGLNITVSTA